MINNFLKEGEAPFNCALFMSGSGTNIEKILEYTANITEKRWIPRVIVTDRPETSRASELAIKFNIPLLALDIKAFYRERGEERVSIMSERGREIREEWTNALREKLQPYDISFGILAGFIPLTNITSDFPCLNVHPGDLTVEDESGRRLLTGLHTIPIETAIINGFQTIRSSVIVAQPYTGSGGEMDTGPVLGISTAVEVDLRGSDLEELKICAGKRPVIRPAGGYKDKLEDIAKINLNRLKEQGDWIVFPQVIESFASGDFGYDENNSLMLKQSGEWQRIKTVEYGVDSRRIII